MTPPLRIPTGLAQALTLAGVLGLLTACSPAPNAAAPSQPADSALTFTPCMLEHPSGLSGVKAECATLEVPENLSGQGRRITLSIARHPAISERKAADPLFVLAGGPGMGAQEMYTAATGAFARINRDRDIILVDQRGTGRSTPLACKVDPLLHSLDRPEPATAIRDGIIDAATRECLDTLRAKHDVAQYTTSVAVRDLEAVREALGAAQVNLYGVSYGSRVAQHYLRRYPDRVRSVILDGVVPPGLALGPAIALDAEAALGMILRRCAAQPACRKAFGNPADTYQTLRARLAASPRTLRLADPRSGELRTVVFGPSHLAGVLRLSSYSTPTAALLPLAMHEAVVKDNYIPLASTLLMQLDTVPDSIAAGMHHSVVCAEDLPFVGEVDRARLAATFMGADLIDPLRRICAIWPRGPVLLLSGSADPVTPPAYAETAMRGLTVARHVVLQDEGHGQLGATCMDRVLRDFIATPVPGKLELNCLEKRSASPFFTSLAGPAP
jgi:pimeloyl-ACP methyl ester carboxylesterase